MSTNPVSNSVVNLQVICAGGAVRHGSALLRQDWYPHPQQVSYSQPVSEVGMPSVCYVMLHVSIRLGFACSVIVTSSCQAWYLLALLCYMYCPA